MCKNCGRTWRKPKTEVVRWGLEDTWYGGLDYPCRGLDISHHGCGFCISPFKAKRPDFCPPAVLYIYIYIYIIHRERESQRPQLINDSGGWLSETLGAAFRDSGIVLLCYLLLLLRVVVVVVVVVVVAVVVETPGAVTRFTERRISNILYIYIYIYTLDLNIDIRFK